MLESLNWSTSDHGQALSEFLPFILNLFLLLQPNASCFIILRPQNETTGVEYKSYRGMFLIPYSIRTFKKLFLFISGNSDFD